MMNNIPDETDKFIEIPVCVDVQNDSDSFNEKVRKAKENMLIWGFSSLLDTPAKKQPPKLRRRVSITEYSRGKE